MPPLRHSSAKVPGLEGRLRGPRRDPLEDEARFLRSWLERPLVTGAVTPSGRMLARTMASYVDPQQDGPVIELGPGTGPVTEALIRRGIAPERLILVEFNPDFCRLLARRFPGVTVIRGDAYDIRATLDSVLAEPGAATISSLPLFTKPLEQRLDLLNAAHDLMRIVEPSDLEVTSCKGEMQCFLVFREFLCSGKIPEAYTKILYYMSFEIQKKVSNVSTVIPS